MKNKLTFLFFILFSFQSVLSFSISIFTIINSRVGGFVGPIDNTPPSPPFFFSEPNDQFGVGIAGIGDLDEDGNLDIAVGAPRDDDFSPMVISPDNRGAIYILFLNASGYVIREQKISSEFGNLPTLPSQSYFGSSIACIGDLNGDQIPDLAIGAYNPSISTSGSVYILFLNRNGTINLSQQISEGIGGFVAPFSPFTGQMGSSVVFLGNNRIMVCAPNANINFIFTLNSDGTVASQVNLASPTDISPNQNFYDSNAFLGDINGDGIFNDFAFGGFGTVTIVSMDNSNNPVQNFTIDRNTLSIPPHNLVGVDLFGISVEAIGDYDKDGITDIVIGDTFFDQNLFLGGFYICTLNSNGSVKNFLSVSAAAPNFLPILPSQRFATSLTFVGDLNGDGYPELMISAPDIESTIFFLTLGRCGDGINIPEHGEQCDDGNNFNFDGCSSECIREKPLFCIGAICPASQDLSDIIISLNSDLDNFINEGDPFEGFGTSMATFDFDGNNVLDLVVGSPLTEQVYLLLLNENGSIIDIPLILDDSAFVVNCPASRPPRNFGKSVIIQDLDNSGLPEILVGAPNIGSSYCFGNVNSGGILTFFLNPNLTLSRTEFSGFPGANVFPIDYGTSITSLGDLNLDGGIDIVVGAPRADDAGTTSSISRGLLFVSNVTTDGTIIGANSNPIGSLTGVTELNNNRVTLFGSSILNLGDLRNDGTRAIAVGAPQDDEGITGNRGAIYIIFLNSTFQVISNFKITNERENLGNFVGGEMFGSSISLLNSFQFVPNSLTLMVGAPGYDFGVEQFDFGAFFFVTLDSTTGEFISVLGIISSSSSLSVLSPGDNFGSSVVDLGDINNDGIIEFAVGVPFDDSGRTDAGAVRILSFDRCGDSLLSQNEECDDGNVESNDGCSSLCIPESGFICNLTICRPLCGDGNLVGAGSGSSEQCDDFNIEPGDGCNENCQIELGFVCQAAPSVCFAECGDGIIAGDEECDDSNKQNGDGCNSNCLLEANSNSNTVAIAISVSIGGFCLLAFITLVFLLIFLLFKEKKRVFHLTSQHLGDEVPILDGPYENLTKIGEGQGGDVFVGEADQAKFALKSLKKVSTEEAIEDFQNECYALLKLQSPNIVRFWGIWSPEPKNQYMVLEYMECGSLSSYLKQRNFSQSELFQLCFGMAQGMIVLENKGFIHRDLAARNLLVDKLLSVKISDFGLSRKLSSTGIYAEEKRPIPLRWTAPEVWEARVYLQKSDVWSFAITSWEIFSLGNLPFAQIPNSQIPNHLLSFKEEDKGPLLDQPAEMPKRFYELLLKCWFFNPQQRPSFNEIISQMKIIGVKKNFDFAKNIQLTDSQEKTQENYTAELISQTKKIASVPSSQKKPILTSIYSKTDLKYGQNSSSQTSPDQDIIYEEGPNNQEPNKQGTYLIDSLDPNKNYALPSLSTRTERSFSQDSEYSTPPVVKISTSQNSKGFNPSHHSSQNSDYSLTPAQRK